MQCKETGLKLREYDFDGGGASMTGCGCVILGLVEELNSTPYEDGPEGEESYEEPEGSDD